MSSRTRAIRRDQPISPVIPETAVVEGSRGAIIDPLRWDDIVAAMRRRDRRRRYLRNWCIIIISYAMTGTAIYGLLTGSVRFGITTALLFASIALLVFITPSMFKAE